MVLFFAANTTNPTYTYPAGWTAVGSPLTGSGFFGRAFTQGRHRGRRRDLGAGDVVGLRQVRHGALRLPRRHRGGGQCRRLARGTATTAHTSPTVSAPAGSKWLVTYWADKTSSTTSWTAPAGQTFRSSRFGSPSGAMSGLLVDSDADVSGSTGGLTATANSSTNRRSASASCSSRPVCPLWPVAVRPRRVTHLTA